MIGTINIILIGLITIYACYKFYNFMLGLNPYDFTSRSNTSIGDVTISKGNSVVDRKDGEKDVKVVEDLDIFSYDTVKTGKGKVAIEFLDDTRVDITEHSKLVIDDFVYDPNQKTGKLSLKASLVQLSMLVVRLPKTQHKTFQ